MKKLLLLLGQIILVTNLFSQKFIEIKDIFPAVKYPHIQFIDFDSDNDLDICVWGIFDNISLNYRSLVVYRNNGNEKFDAINVGSLVTYGSTIGHLNVADINKDNIPEIVSIGNSNKMKFDQFVNNTFSQLSNDDISNLNAPDIDGVSFADFDNDGADEMLYGRITLIDTYKKVFKNVNFDNVSNEWTRWVDINNDGKTDILRIHRGQYEDFSSGFIYLNNGSRFDKRGFNFLERPSKFELGDYNNDGYEDLIIFSYKDRYANQPTVELYKNDKNGNFLYVKDIAKASSGRLVDIDNDGDLDLVLMGYYDVWDQCYLKFYQNKGNDDFVVMQNDSIKTDFNGDICIGDYDKDGDIDLLITNYGYSNSILKLYKNSFVEDNPTKVNTKPSVPLRLKSEVNFNKVKLSWDSSTDSESPSASLSYNIYIKKSDDMFITSPIANINSGYRKIDRKGNAGFKLFYDINCLEDGKYYWSVQTLDNSNKGSEFARVDSFEIVGTKPQPPTELTAKTISDKVIHLKWKDNSETEDGFSVEMYFENNPPSGTAGFYEYKTLNANETECDIDNLLPNTRYIFRVRAYNSSNSSSPSNADTTSTYPPQFTKKIILDNYYGGEAEWGDFDNDGDLDILMFYRNAYGKRYTRIFENRIDSITELEVGLPKVESEVSNCSVNWVDFNRDGLLDIFLIQGKAFSAKKWIFMNNGNKTFTDIKCDSILNIVPGACGPSFADFDNDGDLDMILMGDNTYSNEIKIYENLSNGKFVDSGIRNITGIIKSRMPWSDFNNDGYLDILANERKQDGTSNIIIYKNNGNKIFTKIVFIGLQGLNNDYLNQSGDMRWGDYNNDGFADILISGEHTGSSGIGITKIYKNNGDETFTDSGIDNISGNSNDVSIEWGDYNNDGMLDILQTGAGNTRIFYNKNGIFKMGLNNPFLGPHQGGMSTAADYDDDGDLDILVLGEADYNHSQIALYNNYQFLKNEKPEIPSNLRVDVNNNQVVLKWDRVNDNETLSNGLSYNVYLINSVNDVIVASNALQTGKRKIVGTGNAQQNNFLKIKNLPSGSYRWSVQCIDNCFEGSLFAQENAFNYINTNTGINESIISGVSISPNPFTDVIKVESSNSNENICDVVIRDLMGSKLFAVKDISLPCKINTSQLISGFYTLTIVQDNSILTMKIIKK